MTNSKWTDGPRRMLRQRAIQRLLDDPTIRSIVVVDPPMIEPQRFNPRKPLAGVALCLFRASNAFHECRSETIA